MIKPRFAQTLMNVSQEKTWLRLNGFLFCLAIVGCGPRVIPNSSRSVADSALRNALDAWKAGATVADLRSQSPPIYVSEELWQDGFELLSYEVTSDGEQYGPNVQMQVNLECKQRNVRPRKLIVHYVISTEPAITIARQE